MHPRVVARLAISALVLFGWTAVNAADPAPSAEQKKLETACAKGGPKECYELGTYLEYDAHDPRAAAARYRAGCDRNYAPSCTNLGSLYGRGVGVPHDDAKAAALYRKACDGKDTMACDNLAAFLHPRHRCRAGRGGGAGALSAELRGGGQRRLPEFGVRVHDRQPHACGSGQGGDPLAAGLRRQAPRRAATSATSTCAARASPGIPGWPAASTSRVATAGTRRPARCCRTDWPAGPGRLRRVLEPEWRRPALSAARRRQDLHLASLLQDLEVKVTPGFRQKTATDRMSSPFDKHGGGEGGGLADPVDGIGQHAYQPHPTAGPVQLAFPFGQRVPQSSSLFCFARRIPACAAGWFRSRADRRDGLRRGGPPPAPLASRADLSRSSFSRFRRDGGPLLRRRRWRRG